MATRRSFLAATGLLVAGATLVPAQELCAVSTKATQTGTSAEQALLRLKEGNERFLKGRTIHCDLMSQVKATANAQAPLAAILGCMDSRVPPELVFDQRIGDIFSVRVAGNIVNTDILGSCRRRRRSHVEEQEVRTERGRPECKGRGRGAKLTAHSDGLAALVKDHKLKIVSAMHDVSTGAVKCSPEDICDVTRSAPAAAI